MKKTIECNLEPQFQIEEKLARTHYLLIKETQVFKSKSDSIGNVNGQTWLLSIDMFKKYNMPRGKSPSLIESVAKQTGLASGGRGIIHAHNPEQYNIDNPIKPAIIPKEPKEDMLEEKVIHTKTSISRMALEGLQELANENDIDSEGLTGDELKDILKAELL